MTETRVHYYRCRDCSAVFATRGPVGAARCECDGKLRLMGMVRPAGRSLYRVRVETPCDARCTGAAGPSCDCSCHGENHGTGRVVEVEVDAGREFRSFDWHPARTSKLHCLRILRAVSPAASAD